LELQAQKLGVISAAAGYMGLNSLAAGCFGRMMKEAVPAREKQREVWEKAKNSWGVFFLWGRK
jgi:primase-polymerase (primpol)-like protein